MSKKAHKKTMKHKTKQVLKPKLRFPEFRDDPGWTQKQIAELGTIHKGKGISKSDISLDGKLPCVRYGELYTRYGEVINKVVSKTSVDPSNLFLSQKGDVVIPASGETKADIATASCINLENVALGSDLNVIRSDLNGQFFSYYLNGRKRFEIAKIAQGDTVAHLYPNQLSIIKICYPSPAEQQRIADCLTSLDELVAAHGRKLDALKAHKKGLMQQLFPRQGETQPSLRFPEFSGAGDWINKKLDELAERGTGHTPNKKKLEYYNGGIKWVSLADSRRLDQGLISDTEIEISEQGLNNSSAVLHPAGTVILSRDAGVGKSAVLSMQMAVSQHFIVWRCNSQRLSNWFFYYLLQRSKPIFEDIATGSTIKTIGVPFFKAMHVAVPEVDEQQQIADCLSSLDTQITRRLNRSKPYRPTSAA